MHELHYRVTSVLTGILAPALDTWDMFMCEHAYSPPKSGELCLRMVEIASKLLEGKSAESLLEVSLWIAVSVWNLALVPLAF